MAAQEAVGEGCGHRGGGEGVTQAGVGEGWGSGSHTGGGRGGVWSRTWGWAIGHSHIDRGGSVVTQVGVHRVKDRHTLATELNSGIVASDVRWVPLLWRGVCHIGSLSQALPHLLCVCSMTKWAS